MDSESHRQGASNFHTLEKVTGDARSVGVEEIRAAAAAKKSREPDWQL